MWIVIDCAFGLPVSANDNENNSRLIARQENKTINLKELKNSQESLSTALHSNLAKKTAEDSKVISSISHVKGGDLAISDVNRNKRMLVFRYEINKMLFKQPLIPLSFNFFSQATVCIQTTRIKTQKSSRREKEEENNQETSNNNNSSFLL